MSMLFDIACYATLLVVFNLDLKSHSGCSRAYARNRHREWASSAVVVVVDHFHPRTQSPLPSPRGQRPMSCHLRVFVPISILVSF